MPAIIFAELGCTGRLEMSSFHGLSGGKTCKAARIASASGVLNRTGWVSAGIGGRSAGAAASAADSRAAENQRMAGVLMVAQRAGQREDIHTTRGGPLHAPNGGRAGPAV